jgi:hypothetical protein
MNKYYSNKANTTAAQKIFQYATQMGKSADITEKPKDTDKVNKSSPLPVKKEEYKAADTSKEEMLMAKRLQEAVIWTEILGKPLSKRRKRR